MTEPKFFIHNNNRHLVMTFDWALKNEDLISYLLEVYYFDDKREIDRLEDEESNIIEFVQSIEGNDDGYTEKHLELKGIGKVSYH